MIPPSALLLIAAAVRVTPAYLSLVQNRVASNGLEMMRNAAALLLLSDADLIRLRAFARAMGDLP